MSFARSFSMRCPAAKMKNGVYLVGGFHEMVELLEKMDFPILGIIDERRSSVRGIDAAYPLLGDDAWLLGRGPVPGGDSVVIAPDLPRVRQKLVTKYVSCGFELPPVVGGEVAESCHLADAVVIQSMAYVSSCCNLGRGVRVNVGARVMHDTVIGDFTTVAPAAVLLGRVEVGAGVYIGANATILPGVTIGEGAVVGAGAVVSKNVPPFAVVKGVPAR